MDGNIYTINDSVLYKNGEAVINGVKDVTSCGNDTEYLKDNAIYNLNNGQCFKLDYNIDKINRQCILLENGSVLLRDIYGMDDTYYYHNIADIVLVDGRKYLIKKPTKGTSQIKSIRVY